ncbi:hypothetical protein SETIT_7G068600v2 [Setaria italica]|uniref:Uncharacterized protein n=1 Tax=Setaria italica TaxID=4555 RepID=A0A368RST7_SETIT|nr:hypothetical protein SETIT_7G068600v2 [Setaria italica]
MVGHRRNPVLGLTSLESCELALRLRPYLSLAARRSPNGSSRLDLHKNLFRTATALDRCQ